MEETHLDESPKPTIKQQEESDNFFSRFAKKGLVALKRSEAPQTTQVEPPKELRYDQLREDEKAWADEIKKRIQEVLDGTKSIEEVSTSMAVTINNLDTTLRKSKNVENALKENIDQDELGDILNKNAFDFDLASEAKSGRKFGLLVLDIDDFKRYNTDFGHGGGNIAIKTVCKRIDELTRKEQEDKTEEKRRADKVYRLHGDELAVMVYDIDSTEDLKEVAERLRAGATDEVVKIRKDQNVVDTNLSLSVGGGIFSGGDPQTIFDEVDIEGLYGAKHNGKNQSFIIGFDQVQQKKAA